MAYLDSPFLDMLNEEDRKKQRLLDMQQQEFQQQQTPAQQLNAATPPRPAESYLTAKDRNALIRHGTANPFSAMESPTLGTALLKTIGSGFAGQQGRKEKATMKEALIAERKREAVKDKADEAFRQSAQALDTRRVVAQESEATYRTGADDRAQATLEEKRTHDAKLLEDQRAYTERQDKIKLERAEELRVRQRDEKREDVLTKADVKVSSEDEAGVKAMIARKSELERALPHLARLAGIETGDDEERLGPDYKDDRGWWERTLTGGAGPIAGKIPGDFSRDTQEMSRLANSEALRTIGELDTPLTPVSDRDMVTIFGVGISPDKGDQYNYDSAIEALNAIDDELAARSPDAALTDAEKKRLADLEAREGR